MNLEFRGKLLSEVIGIVGDKSALSDHCKFATFVFELDAA